MAQFKIIFIFLSLGGLSLFFNNCSQVDLTPMEEAVVSVETKGHFCTELPEDSQIYSKYLFVIDFSSSNSGTDPRADGLTQRYLASNKFYQKHKDEANASWSFLLFSDDLRENLIETAGSATPFSQDEGVINRALDDLRLRPDDRGTPYLSALSHIQEVLEEDLRLDRESGKVSNYSIFFISDGSPNDSSAGPQILDNVETIVNLSPGRIYLSTGYYGTKRVDIISEMAVRGNGLFANFNDGPILFDQLVIGGNIKEPWFIKEFLVYNLNSAFCEDGFIDADSDADGLCDRDEEKLIPFGFDPYNHFSFGDGYGDLFHWRKLNNLLGDLPPCDDRSDVDHDLLTACEEELITNSAQLEGLPTVADPLNPDTDGDGIIDGIETLVYFRNTLAFALSPTNLYRSSVDQEDDDAGTQIKQHRSPNYVDPHSPHYDTTLSPQGVRTDGRSCYAIQQSVLPLYSVGNNLPENNLVDLSRKSNENTILIYYLQVKQSAPDSAGTYHYSVQNVRANEDLPTSIFSHEGGLKVGKGSFTTYIIP